MAEAKDIPVQIFSRNNKELPATMGILNEMLWTKRERLRRSGKTLLICLGLMCGSALIPFFHYFLVPALFVAALVFAMDKYAEVSSFEGGRGECPKCHQELSLQRSKKSNRVLDTCGACNEEVEVKVKE